MAWVRLDDHFDEHDKVLAAGPDAMWVLLRGLAFCNRRETDGHIPVAALNRIGSDYGPQKRRKLVARLVDVGLVHAPTHDCPRCPQPTEGWQVHDYADYQPTRAQKQAERGEARERMRRARAAKNTKGSAHVRAEHTPEHEANTTRSSDNPVPVPGVPTEPPPAPAREAAEPAQPADPPGQGGTATPPTPTPHDAAGQALDAIVAAAPAEHADTLRDGPRSPKIRRRLEALTADGWKPSELAHRVSQLGWRVDHADGAVLHRLRAIDGPPPNRVAAEQRTAEQQEAERRDADAAAKQQRRAELDAVIDAMPADEQAQLATQAAAACPFPREPDLTVPAVRGMARSIIAERLEPADGGTR